MVILAAVTMTEATEEEKILLPQFRRNLHDLNEDQLDSEDRSDKHLLRWLRARELDLARAEEMIRKSMEWRRQNRINSSLLSFRPPPFYLSSYRIQVTGFDDEGCPVVIAPFWDVRPVASSQRDTFIRYVDSIIYRVANECKSRGITQFIFVSDLTGFEWKHLMDKAAIEVLLDCIRNFEDNYPESLKAAIALNAPKIFTILFNLIKPLLTPRTLAKVQICGQDPSKWKPILADKIPLRCLPIKYGGILSAEEIERQDFMGLWTSMKVSANNFDHNINLNDDEAAENPENWPQLQVGSGEKFDMEFPIESPNSVLKYNFKTEKNDIGFMVVLKRKKSQDPVDGQAVVVPYERFEAQDGALVCEQPGTYVCTFDNTFSRFRAKLVKYFVQVYPPPSHLSNNSSVAVNPL